MAGPSLMATLGANIGPFIQQLEAAKGQAAHHGEGIGSALGEGLMGKLEKFGELAVVEETFRRTFEWAERLSILSSRTGLGTDELQKMEGIASKTGTSVESLASFYERLGKAMATAHKEGPKGETSGALERLGVTGDTLAKGDMPAAMQEVAEHFQRIGQITPQVEADLAKIFKNAREMIPALKAMTVEEDAFSKSVSVAPEKMAAMATIMETLKDGWRVISYATKSVVGTIAEGVVGLTKMAKWSGLSLLGGKPSELYAEMDKEEAERKKRVEGLHGQKPGDPGYAKDKADKEAEKHEATAAAAKAAHDAKEIASLAKKTEEEERRAKLAAMSHAERVKALQMEADLMETGIRLGRPHGVELAERQLELAKTKRELETEKREEEQKEQRKRNEEATREAFKDKRATYEVNALMRTGGVVGTFSASNEIAMTDVLKESNNHLAEIRKDIRTLVFRQGETIPEDVTF